jgi:hypothetical protein
MDQQQQQQQQQEIARFLEKCYQSDKNPSAQTLNSIAGVLKVKVDAVVDWFAKRKALDANKSNNPVEKENLCVAATSLKIGKWSMNSKIGGDLCVEIDWVNETMKWSRLDRGIIQQIQFPFSSVEDIYVQVASQVGLIRIRLANAPRFVEEIDPLLSAEKKWVEIADFTGAQSASELLDHSAYLTRNSLIKVAQLLRGFVPRFKEMIDKSQSRVQAQPQQQQQQTTTNEKPEQYLGMF